MSTATALPVFKAIRIVRSSTTGNNPQATPHRTALHKP